MAKNWDAIVLQYRVLFPLLAFGAVAIASDTYGEAALWLASPALLLYLLAPLLPIRAIRKRLLRDQPPAPVAERWSAICQEYEVGAELRLIKYGSVNGISWGGRRGGIAALSPEALELDEPSLDRLLRHLAAQLRMGISRHSARATLLWLYAAAFCAGFGSYVYFTDDEISLLGWILSLAFGVYFLLGAGSYGHQAKWAVDRHLVRQTGDGKGIRALVERVIQQSPPFSEVEVPAFTGPLWFALPHGDKEKGESPEWDSLTQDRFKEMARAVD